MNGVGAGSLMALVQQLVARTDTLAAIGARLRAETDGVPVNPATAPLVDELCAAAGYAPEAVPEEEKRAPLGFIRAFLQQAVELVESPDRAAGWTYDDPVVLQSIGRGSASIADVIASVAPSLDGLDERLAQRGAAILDVGTGTGWLAIALAERFPAAQVVGIDIWEPSLALARDNASRSSVADRVEVRRESATELEERDRYDLVWVACPFLGLEVLPAATRRAAAALRPGGWVALGFFAGSGDRVDDLAADLRTVRSGGHVWRGADLVAIGAEAGLHGLREVEKSWPQPVRLLVGRRA